jgi:rifampicin phosphotransferase
VSLVSLTDLRPADVVRVGAKAWNCARLKQAGFRVPDGLVVTGLASDDDSEGILQHPWLARQPPDALFAVRSSGLDEDAAGHSFAGIHETQLNVRRGEVGRAAAAIQASARSTQAVAYRRAVGLPIDQIKTAVLIQLMIQPVAAGVAFTKNPVSGANDEMIVNSAWGLGETLVAGQITPDDFRIRKSDGMVLAARGTGNLSLTQAQLLDLWAILQSLERHYGFPQDVEWCHDGSDFWIVQSRPITTQGTSNGTEWTRANLAEVLPDITSPQALAAFEDMLNEGQRRFMGRLMAPEADVGPMFKSFNGRLYFNLSQLRHISAMAGTPPARMLKSLGHPGEIRPEDEVPAVIPLRQRARALPTLLNVVGRHLSARRSLRKHDANIAALHARVTAADPEKLTDQEMWLVLDEWIRDAPDAIQLVLTFGGVLFYEEQLRSICEKAGVDPGRFLVTQLAAGERSVSAQQAFDLTALAALARREPVVRSELLLDPPDIKRLRHALRGTSFLAGFEGFLETYGHRGLYESDWALPRYAEDPTPLLMAIRGHLSGTDNRDDAGTAARQAKEAAAAWSVFERRLSWLQRWTWLPRARQIVKRIKQYYVWREHCRFEMVRILSAFRRWHLVLGRRFVERGLIPDPGDYFLLRLEDVGRIVRGAVPIEQVREIVAVRRAQQATYRRIKMPLLMRESELPALIRLADVSAMDSAGDLRGLTTSPGCAEGEVAVILEPGDFARMKRGSILVARATDPSWTPLFTLAAGVIVELGGLLSHASTVAREYGLPALANVPDATKRLRTGERVILNATEGFVRRLDDAGAVETDKDD